MDRPSECRLRVSEDRIQRAIDTLKEAKRYRVSVERKGVVHWNVVEDGYVTDSAAVDEALAILEEERDEV